MIEGKKSINFNAPAILVERFDRYVVKGKKNDRTDALNQLMELAVNQYTNKDKKIDVEILKKKKSSLKTKIDEMVLEFENLTIQIDSYKKEIEKEEIQKMEQDKNKNAKLQQCQQCGDWVKNRPSYYEYKVGAICKNCHMLANSSQIMEWGGSPIFRKNEIDNYGTRGI